MWNKIYLITLAAAAAAMGVLLYLPYSWLGSVTDPKNVALNFTHYANISWTFLLVSSLILLILANVLLFNTRRAWGMWATLVYFAVFTIAQSFWLEQSFFNYRQANKLPTDTFFLGSLIAVLCIVLAAIFVFFNQYLVKRMQGKMSPQVETVRQISE